MSDLISRQAVIDVIEDSPHGDVWNVESMEEMTDRIKQLPPAQPETICSEIPNSSTDCISRQAVVKFFNDWISCLDENCHHQSVADMTIIKNDFKNLPSAQPETTRRIVGKSKGGMTLWYECERCGEPVDEGDKFCRGCGAKMEVNHESN